MVRNYANRITQALEYNLVWGYNEEEVGQRTVDLAGCVHETFLNNRGKHVPVEDIKDFILEKFGMYEDDFVQRYNRTVVRYLYEHLEQDKIELTEDFLSYHDSFLFDVADILTDIEKNFIDSVYMFCEDWEDEGDFSGYDGMDEEEDEDD